MKRLDMKSLLLAAEKRSQAEWKGTLSKTGNGFMCYERSISDAGHLPHRN
ncbi:MULTISPECIES: hypothetical protein [unclassified Imperialibacter]|nr:MULTISPECIES: hypothetical protein [unclassified Imperialibacter]